MQAKTVNGRRSDNVFILVSCAWIMDFAQTFMIEYAGGQDVVGFHGIALRYHGFGRR
ncbi:MAG: hypothetical protein QM811_02515 [Pirellulales bacterium]